MLRAGVRCVFFFWLGDAGPGPRKLKLNECQLRFKVRVKMRLFVVVPVVPVVVADAGKTFAVFYFDFLPSSLCFFFVRGAKPSI